MRPTVQLESEPQQPAPKGGLLHLTSTQKAVGVTLLLGLIWVRTFRRRKKIERTCSSCNQKNPRHLTNCTKCGAPLFGG
jgi:hypothetical protein